VMNTNLVILGLIVLAFGAMVGLGRYGERKRRQRVLGRLFNVPCPKCKTLLGDRKVALVAHKNFKAMAPSGSEVLMTSYRVQCKKCGHQMVCEEKQ
jgi:ribosomal protein S27E